MPLAAGLAAASRRPVRSVNPGRALDKAGAIIVVANPRAAAPNKAVRIEVDKPRKIVRRSARTGVDRGLSSNPRQHGETGPERDPQGYVSRPQPDLPVQSGIQVQRREIEKAVHDQARPEQSGRFGVDHPFGHRLWHSRYAGAVEGEQDRVDGCIRCTNWDAVDLAAMGQKGMSVAFLEGETDAIASALEEKSSRSGSRGRSSERRSR